MKFFFMFIDKIICFSEVFTLEINKFEAEKIQVLEEITKLEDEERDWQNKAGTLRLAMTHNTEETREGSDYGQPEIARIVIEEESCRRGQGAGRGD